MDASWVLLSALVRILTQLLAVSSGAFSPVFSRMPADVHRTFHGFSYFVYFLSDFVDSDRRPAQFSNYVGVIIMIVSMLSTRYNSL